ncbi:MAG: fibronectin type III domain-containing protein [Cyclobacteriaceae bacterium]
MEGREIGLMKYYWIVLLLVIVNFSCSEDNEPAGTVSGPEVTVTATTPDQIEVEWTAIDGVEAYEIDVALDADFDDVLSDYDAVKVRQTELIIEDLKASTTYFIRVRGLFSNGVASENSNTLEAATANPLLCDDYSDYVFNEKDGIVKVEFEDAEFGPGWELQPGNGKTSGRGYMVWTMADYFSGPSSDLVTYNIKVSTPGTYQFIWNSAVTKGSDGTEHNDTWLKFPAADDFYGDKGGAIVYPKGSGKTPNPEGASKDGWFKVYRSGNDVDFKWQSRTSDNDPHEIYVRFDEAKIYTMQISARSNGHGIDKFALFLESLSQSNLTGLAEFSEITCL